MIVRFLAIFVVVLLLTGLFWPLLTSFGLGRLPGDVVVERGRFKLYIPLMTSILISAAVTFVFSAALWFGSQS
jgi:hypothetical protein